MEILPSSLVIKYSYHIKNVVGHLYKFTGFATSHILLLPLVHQVAAVLSA